MVPNGLACVPSPPIAPLLTYTSNGLGGTVPVGPVAPVGPVDPVGPVIPVGPVGP